MDVIEQRVIGEKNWLEIFHSPQQFLTFLRLKSKHLATVCRLPNFLQRTSKQNRCLTMIIFCEFVVLLLALCLYVFAHLAVLCRRSKQTDGNIVDKIWLKDVSMLVLLPFFVLNYLLLFCAFLYAKCKVIFVM